MKTIQLDKYLNVNDRTLFIYIGLFFSLSLLINFSQITLFYSLLLSTLSLTIICIIFIVIKLQKSLILENEKLYNALTFYNYIIQKREINIKTFTSGQIKRLNKSTDSWLFWFWPISVFTREYNAAAIFLISDKNKEIRILSLSNMDAITKAVQFIEANTEIRFPKYTFLKK